MHRDQGTLIELYSFDVTFIPTQNVGGEAIVHELYINIVILYIVYVHSEIASMLFLLLCFLSCNILVYIVLRRWERDQACFLTLARRVKVSTYCF